MTAATSTTLSIDIVSDVVCPWCYIGKRHVEAALAQFGAARPDVTVVDIRGNVPTRLARVAGLDSSGPGDLDAVVLASSGLRRLGHPVRAACGEIGSQIVR